MNITENPKTLKSPYLKYAKNIFTQNGEDGIIERLLKELNKNTGIVVEFGAHNGLFVSNTYNLWKYKKFNGILIESDPDLFMELTKNIMKFENVEIFNCFVSDNKKDINSFDSILDKSKFDITSDNFVLLSIDVDCIDYYIFETIEKYLPIILIIETQTDYDFDKEIIKDGCSIKSITNLAKIKDYSLVVSTGNCFFVRNDYLYLLEIDIKNFNIEDIYVETNFVNSILQHLNENGDIIDEIYFLSKYYNEKLLKENDLF